MRLRQCFKNPGKKIISALGHSNPKGAQRTSQKNFSKVRCIEDHSTSQSVRIVPHCDQSVIKGPNRLILFSDDCKGYIQLLSSWSDPGLKITKDLVVCPTPPPWSQQKLIKKRRRKNDYKLLKKTTKTTKKYQKLLRMCKILL